MYRLILELDIPTSYKTLALVRFRRIFEHVDTSFHSVQRYYTRSKCFVITASILNPALLSMSADTDTHFRATLFWVVWTMQLLVSLVTAYVNFYKWDKKYFVYMVYKQRVEQEIWTYLELTGKYGIVNPFNAEEVEGMETTHRSKIKRFLFQLETIYRKLQDTDFGIENTDADATTESIASSNHEREAKQRAGAVGAKIRDVEQRMRALANEGSEADATVEARNDSAPLSETEWQAVDAAHVARNARQANLERELERYHALQARNQEIDTQIQAMHSTVSPPRRRRTASVGTSTGPVNTGPTETPPNQLFAAPMAMATAHATPRAARRPHLVPPVDTADTGTATQQQQSGDSPRGEEAV